MRGRDVRGGRIAGRLALLAAGLLLLTGLGWAPAPFSVIDHLRVPFTAGALLLLLLSALLRSWPGVLLASLAAAINLAVVAPHLSLGGPAPAAADIRLVHSNIWNRNADPARIATMLQQEQPDVAVLLEVNDPGRDAWLKPLETLFPFRATCGDAGCGVLILSRWPLERLETGGSVAGHLGYVAARIDRPAGAFTLAGVHLPQPFRAESQAEAARWVAARLQALPGPVVLTGDFNAAPWSGLMADFAAASGLHRLAPTQTTWPVWLGPFGIPIDHVFGSTGVSAEARALGNVGSDHRPVAASIRLPDP
ncbi:endonuclease/exonuclease/phosphatase family protein [Oleisolibacter albus]|uniref:endonuclease/exonuclease/phosphatase family protein n=1 Tax=Oleisolibacter albus TaxID=2171757 RepID=UPI000DF300A9|nr:endonuclease/exonuclease/phosphatase family protein [Oleisolibacter albus]